MYHRHFKRSHRHFNRPVHLEMSTQQMHIIANFRPITIQRYTMRNVISGVTAPKFTKFLHDMAASLPVLTPLSRWRNCIPFWNDRGKTEGSQFQRLQKAPKINWLL